MMTLSIINPVKLKDIGINVDFKYRLDNEELFDPENITWIFYGLPYEHIIIDNGSVETKYGFSHSYGYIESITNSNIKFDVLYGMLINRINLNLDNYISDSDLDLESETKLKYKKNYDNSIKEINKLDKLKRKDNFSKYKKYV